MNDESTPSMHSRNESGSCIKLAHRGQNRRFLLLGLGLILVMGVWFYREPLRARIRESATLANDAPTPEVVSDMIEQASDPRAALLSAWNSGKIIHREVAMNSLMRVFPDNVPLPAEVESMLLSAALDPDMNVRELAFGIMRDRNHPALGALAAEQLNDPDQQVRIMGLNHLKFVPSSVGIPVVTGLLNDPDIAVLGLGLKLLENWSGQKFGATLVDTVQVENPNTGLQEFQVDGMVKTRAAAENAKKWWSTHQSEYPPVKLQVPTESFVARRLMPAPGFELHSLEGKTVRLSDFRGRVVLVNFWTTRCTACIGEMPELVALQKKHGDELVILGVSLDNVPDNHGHVGGDASTEEQRTGFEHEENAATAASLEKVRNKVARAAKERHLNYQILLDEKNDAGGRYNGGELPTTVIVDAQGNLRRRFVGTRSMAVFEAMVAEAATPVSIQAGTPNTTK